MEEFIFLDAEIEEDDDLAPVGTLIKKGDDVAPVEDKGQFIEEAEIVEGDDLDDVPVAKLIAKEEAAEEKVEEPVEDAIAEEQSTEDNDEDFSFLDEEAPVEETVQDEVIDEQPVEDTIEETPVEEVEDTVSEESVEEANEEPIAEEITEEPIIEEVVQEEVIDEQPAEEPIVEDAIEDAVAQEEPVEDQVSDDEITEEPITEEAPAEDTIQDEVIDEQPTEEPVVEEAIEDTTVEEEPVEDAGISLKESMAMAAVTNKGEDTSLSMSKQVVYDYLNNNCKGLVELNRRENYTKTGLPLADTHYDIQGKKKVCFIYVYELENNNVLFLIRANAQTAKAIKEKHSSLAQSAFPKSAAKDWYTMVLDGSFKSNEDVYEVLDMILGIKREKQEEIVEVKKAPAKKKAAPKKVEEPVQEEPVKKIAVKKGIGLSKDETEVQKALNDSQFEVKKQEPVKVIKKEPVVDVWAVAQIGKKETPKKTAPKKVEEKPVEVKEEPIKKAPAKKKTSEINKNIEIEDKKLEEKKVAETNPDEKIIVEANLELNPNPGKFVIKKTDKGNFVYKLFAFNKRVVAIGAEPYADLQSCKSGINSVAKNAETAPIEDQTLKTIKEQKCPKWIVYQDKKGEFRLRLIASNGNIVATTNDGYTTKAAAIKGIEAIGRAAKGAFVARNDNLW